MSKVFLISKSNLWSDKLNDLIQNEYNCSYFNDDSYIDYLSENPDWIFFFHWSKIVSEKVYKNHRCVVIHTGNLPEGRGGSPIQNQILDGILESKVNAIVMDKELDAGDIYCSLPITLQGSLTDIWLSIADRAYKLIKKCVNEYIKPTKQVGNTVVYLRNKNNVLPLDKTNDIIDVHKFIQMLDGDGYSNSYYDIGNFRLEFSRSKIDGNHLISDVIIRGKDE